MAVSVRSAAVRILSGATAALFLAFWAFRCWQTGRLLISYGPGAVPGLFWMVIYALYPRLRLFENGVELPTTQGQHKHFLTWRQVDRYGWENDTLTLTGTDSLLAGGPVTGGSARIPAGQRQAVEQILSAKVGTYAL